MTNCFYRTKSPIFYNLLAQYIVTEYFSSMSMSSCYVYLLNQKCVCSSSTFEVVGNGDDIIADSDWCLVERFPIATS